MCSIKHIQLLQRYNLTHLNDGSVRALDVESKIWKSTKTFRHPVNCAASSPDGHARVLVYDHMSPRVVDKDGKKITT